MIHAEVRLPQLIGSGMVLQRDLKLNIWGWASPGEKVSLKFKGKRYHATTDKDGKWNIVLPPSKAGGPFSMEISASNTIVLNDILIGDVWFCSGQSNMVLPMERVKEKYPEEISGAHYTQIRNFFIPTASDLAKVHDDLPPGKWVQADPENVLSFGAATYFFAKQLFNKYQIPIGIINSSVGGTPIQAWISEAGIQSVPRYAERLAQIHDTAYMRVQTEKMQNLFRLAGGAGGRFAPPREPENAAGGLAWYDPAYVAEGWKPFWLPGYLEDQGVADFNGVVWFRKEIDVPASMAGKAVKLFMGRIVDSDKAYVNGVQVGEITYQYPPRRYTLPEGLLKAGKNLIVLRVVNSSGKGGFVPDRRYYMTDGSQEIDLRGDWQYKVEQAYPVFAPMGGMRRMGGVGSAQNEPTGLYNTMVAPAIPYAVKGVLWYQGESNSGQPDEYKLLLPALIADWRKQWKNETLPFLFAQLPNYMEVRYTPSESQWAVLREAQANALSIPHTGMAVTIDAGEWNDIHPLNKKSVGERLATAAERVAYNDLTKEPSGPIYQSAQVEGDKIVVTLAHTGSGLTVRGGGELSQFAIAGADKQFVWAKALIEGDNKVVVSSPLVAKPLYVRYAWADNPEGANLYTKEDMPASPFRTDVPGDVLTGGVWNNKRCAVALTYDDAIDEHLDNVIPVLDVFGFKGTFYVIGSSASIEQRIGDWRSAALAGHELGNHTLFHPCGGGPGRGFVSPDTDLNKYSLSRAVNEIKAANALLEAIDGKKTRTFAYPCGDTKIGEVAFYDQVKDLFVGARGVRAGLQTASQVDLDNINCYMISGHSADYMIDLVKKAQESNTLLVFLFHGVGGGHNINVAQDEHDKLLQYLKQNENDIWVAPLVEIADRIKKTTSGE